MEFNDIHIGMKCGSKKGSGTVTWIDGSTRTIYLANTEDNNSFEVNFDEIIDDPQVHNREDTYYQHLFSANDYPFNIYEIIPQKPQMRLLFYLISVKA